MPSRKQERAGAPERSLIAALSDSRWDLAQAALDAGASLDTTARFDPRRNALDCAYEDADPASMAWCIERGASLAAKDFWGVGASMPVGHAFLDRMAQSALEASGSVFGSKLRLPPCSVPAWERLARAYFGKAKASEIDKPHEGEALLACAAIWDFSLWTALALGRGADPELEDRFGNRALGKACRSGSPESARMLIDAGADMDAANVNGATALAMSAPSLGGDSKWRSHLDCALLLIEGGASMGTAMDPRSDAMAWWRSAGLGKSWSAGALQEIQGAMQERALAPKAPKA